MGDFEEALAAAMAELNVGPTVRQGLLSNDLTCVVDFANVSEEDLIQGGLTKLAATKLLQRVLPRARQLVATQDYDVVTDPPPPPVPARTYTTLHRPRSDGECSAASAPARAARPLPPVPPPDAAHDAAPGEAIYAEPLPAAFVVTGCEVPEWNGNYYHVPQAEVQLTLDPIPIGEVYRHETASAFCYTTDEYAEVAGSRGHDGVVAWVLIGPNRPDQFVRGPQDSHRESETRYVNVYDHTHHIPLPNQFGWYLGALDQPSTAQPSRLRIEISDAYVAATGLQRVEIIPGEDCVQKVLDAQPRVYTVMTKFEPRKDHWGNLISTDIPLEAGARVEVIERKAYCCWKVQSNGQTGFVPPCHLKPARVHEVPS